MSSHATLREVLQAALELPPADKAELVKALLDAPTKSANPKHRALRGILKGSPLSKADIDKSRQELWAGFPREMP
jgi:hypothetical protein